MNGNDFYGHVMFFNLLHGYVANNQTLQADQCASMRGTGYCDEAPWECHQARGECHHVSKIGRTTTVKKLVGRSFFEVPIKVIQLSEKYFKTMNIQLRAISVERNLRLNIYLVVKVASNLLFTVKNPEEDYSQIVKT